MSFLEKLNEHVNNLQRATQDTLKFEDYLELVKQNPRIAQLSHARIYGMVKSAGVEDVGEGDRKHHQYNFFKDEIFGIDDVLDDFTEYFHSSAKRLEIRKRILLLMGPPGAGKSTLVSLLKRELEKFSISEDGKVYAIMYPEDAGEYAGQLCPMREEPLHAVPQEFRAELAIHIEGELCPLCRHIVDDELAGDFTKLLARRVILSEQKRSGIGVFQPTDVKCVTGDTLLLSDEGIISFDELATRYDEGEDIFANMYLVVNSLDKKNNIATRFYNGGVVDTRRIKLRGGYELEGSFNHPVLVAGEAGPEWRKLEDIKLGDLVTLRQGQRIWGNDQTLDAETAKLLGLLVAEGWHYHNDIEFTNNDQHLIDFVVNAWCKLGANPHIYDKGNSKQSVVVCSTKWAKWLDELNIGRGAANKRIPELILKAPESIVLAFVEGLLSGDGHLGSRRELESNYFNLSTSSFELADQFRTVMLNLGIVTFTYTNKTDHLDNYVVSGYNQELEKLLKFIPALSYKFIGTLAKGSKDTNWNYIPVPAWVVKTALDEIRQQHGAIYKLSDVVKYQRYSSESSWGRQFTSASLAEFKAVVKKYVPESNILNESNILKMLDYPSDLIWLPVQQITEGRAQVWDLTVPNSHSFVANGIVNHNSQDISDLVGSIDLSTIGEYGSESDPRAYRFDGEANVANRGMLEMVEMLKVDEKFLYLLLTLSQEQSIKAGRFPMIYADEVIIAHSNEAEYRAWASDKKSEALRDRVIVLTCPYNLRVDDEVKIYEKLIGQTDVLRNAHIDPLALKAAATFAVLTRLEEPKKVGYDRVKKLKLYNGELIVGVKEKDVKELKEQAEREGMDGIGPRYIINQLSMGLVRGDKHCMTTVDVLRALREGLETSPSISKEVRKQYNDFIIEARKEYDDGVKVEIQKAFVHSFEEQANTTLKAYLDNVEASCNKEKVTHPVTGEDVEPDERFMRSIEEQIDVSEVQSKSFREDILIRLGSYYRNGKEFKYDSHPRLKEGIEKKLFTDLKDIVKVTTSTKTPDKEQLEKLNSVAKRLIEEHGYCEVCAHELLQYVGTMLSR